MVKKENKLRILTFLTEHRTDAFSIREIAKQLNIDYKNTYFAVHQMQHTLQMQKKSGTNFIAYRPILSVEQYVVERRRTEELLKRQAFRRIAQEIETLPELFVLLLFGSYAKGTQKKDSDIDLLLIAEHAKPIVSKIKSLPLPTHITAITPKELNEMRNSKEFSVVSEALKQNIIIHGIEEYYRFIKDVD